MTFAPPHQDEDGFIRRKNFDPNESDDDESGDEYEYDEEDHEEEEDDDIDEDDDLDEEEKSQPPMEIDLGSVQEV